MNNGIKKFIILTLFIAMVSESMAMGLEELKNKKYLKKSEVQSLLKSSDWIKDDMLTTFFGGNDTYVNRNSDEVLSVYWDSRGGVIFPDKSIVYKVATEPDTLKPVHLLNGIFNYDSDFPEKSEFLAEMFWSDSLKSYTNNSSIFSFESFEALDEYVENSNIDDILKNRAQKFEKIIAYVGEFARVNYGYSWKMVKDNDNQWEPWLIDKQGRQYPIFSPIYKELFSYEKGKSSVVGVAIGELNKFKFQGGL